MQEQLYSVASVIASPRTASADDASEELDRLVESEEGHKDAILLLDEPGLLIDGEHLHRVRPVTEDDSGHSHISVATWPKDRETISPLQAAAGYAMVRALFQHARNALVEGMSDYATCMRFRSSAGPRSAPLFRQTSM